MATSSKCLSLEGRGDGLSEQTHVTGVFWIVEPCMVERRRKELSGEGSIVKRKMTKKGKHFGVLFWAGHFCIQFILCEHSI